MPAARRPSAQARARRRAGQKRLLMLIAGVAVLIIVVIASTGGGSASPGKDAAKKTALAKAKTPAVVDPLTTPGVHHWIASRKGDVSAAVLNLKTGKEWLLNPDARDQTASIIKADILETLLYQTRKAGDPVGDAEGSVPQGMIEASDNTDATALWDQIGGATGIGAYNALVGLTQTTPNTQGFWGETTTSAADQIKILEQLSGPSKLLTKADQAYQLSLMTDIDPGEQWGVSGGVPKGVKVALKNGWVPLTSNVDWEVNSIGWIDGDDHDYLLAVLSAHDPSEGYGINTIRRIAASVYRTFGTEGVTAKSSSKTTAGTTKAKSKTTSSA